MNSIERKDKRKLLFYICGISLPVLQFVIFYLIINFNSILMAFQNYDIYNNNFFFTLNNFSNVWKDVFNATGESLGVAFLNSLKYFVVSIIFSTGFNILFSNYIYKKNIGHKFFQIILFLPKILSASVLSVVFMHLLNEGAQSFMMNVFGTRIDGLLSNELTKFNYIMIFTIWSGFGTGVLMYTSTMSGISCEVVESAQLDGITPFRELIYITLPMIYPTFVTFMVVNFAAIFTNEMSLYLFYGYFGSQTVNNMTIGYYLFKEARLAQSFNDMQQFTYLSTFGVMLSVIAVPLTFIFKWFLEKVGPSFE
ncbi:MAG: sugar ABC transporter permease [Clostridia bacterium]|nr:sugar ABC transporter permease [Clostridia bacterium]